MEDIRKVYDSETLSLISHLSQRFWKILNQLSALYISSTDRYTVCNDLLKYSAVAGNTPRVVVPSHGDLRLQIMY